MEYTKLGNTEITVSKICVGCMSFGKAGTMHDWTLDETATESVVRHALDLGINFFDTANGYSAGTSEEYLGRALQKNTQREKVVIASKVYFNPGRLSRAAIHREIDGTLRRLGTDYLESIALTMKRLLKRPWKRCMIWCRQEKSGRWVRLPCMATSSIICSWRQRNMAGRSFRRWKTTIICCTGRTNGN